MGAVENCGYLTPLHRYFVRSSLFPPSLLPQLVLYLLHAGGRRKDDPDMEEQREEKKKHIHTQKTGKSGIEGKGEGRLAPEKFTGDTCFVSARKQPHSFRSLVSPQVRLFFRVFHDRTRE